MYVVHIYGGIAQLARVLGSYPIGRRFESHCRYQINTPTCLRCSYIGLKARLIRPGGQAVKTPPFHGGNTSSILVRVTKAILNKAPEKSSFLGALAFPNTYNKTE